MASKHVTKVDLESGRLAKAFSGAFDIIAEGPGAPCRRIHADAAVVITGTDGANVSLPDYGAGYVWDIQAIAIVSGSGVVVW